MMMMMVMVKAMAMLNNIGSVYSGGLSYFLPEEVSKSCFTALHVYTLKWTTYSMVG